VVWADGRSNPPSDPIQGEFGIADDLLEFFVETFVSLWPVDVSVGVGKEKAIKSGK